MRYNRAYLIMFSCKICLVIHRAMKFFSQCFSNNGVISDMVPCDLLFTIAFHGFSTVLEEVIWIHPVNIYNGKPPRKYQNKHTRERLLHLLVAVLLRAFQQQMIIAQVLVANVHFGPHNFFKIIILLPKDNSSSDCLIGNTVVFFKTVADRATRFCQSVWYMHSR